MSATSDASDDLPTRPDPGELGGLSGGARPRGIPVAADWSPADNEWQLKQVDEEGLLHGPFRSWRADGSARAIGAFVHGKEAGPAWKFHPDGSLFFLGCFADGAARGVHRRYANADPQGERLQPCCVPPGAWQLRQDYSRPDLVDRGWFNRHGERLLESGEPYPERPASVPPEAWFNESMSAWETGVVFEEKGYTGTLRRWSRDGVLRLVEDLRRGKRHGQMREHGDDGTLMREARYVEGRLSGPFRAVHAAAVHFADPNVVSELGSFADDLAEGVWRYLDDKGTVIRQLDLGVPATDRALSGGESPALANERRPAASWRALAETLFGERRVDEALLAAARAAAQAGDPADIIRALDRWTCQLRKEPGLREAHQVLEKGGENPALLLDALRRGRDAPTLLWALAKALPANDGAALDLVSAALLLTPDAVEPLATRALLHGTLGDLASARADVARIGAVSPEQGEFLDLYLRIYFPRFTFWPERESFAPMGADAASLRIERQREEVVTVIQRYATRLGRLRAALQDRLAHYRETGNQDASVEVSFMIPDLSLLLPSGPVALSRWSYQMSADEYGGVEEDGAAQGEGEGQSKGESETESSELSAAEDPADRAAGPVFVEITVDETRGIDPLPADILRILRTARADWSGLVWLCWAVGLDAPALPGFIGQRPEFAAAAFMTMERTWRCHDKLRTSGLLALTKGIPGFDWEGTSIDLVPAALADVALDEYVEARAVFSWLCDPGNRSPWQDDLRNPEA